MTPRHELPIIPMDQCIRGRVYKIRCRNLGFGVWNGKDGFIGIRYKFGDRFLFTEYHWDAGAPFGTVRGMEDTGKDVPEGIPRKEHLHTEDKETKHHVKFDKPVKDGGKGWYFTKTGASSLTIVPVSVRNKKLFDFLDTFKDEDDE